jgi:stage V sporulation protein G
MSLDFKVAKIFCLPDAGNLKAFADISVNDSLVIKGLRVVEGKNGLFVSMPREQGKDSKWYDQVSCTSTDVFDDIANKVLTEYQTAAG